MDKPRLLRVGVPLVAAVLGFTVARVWPARFVFVSAGSTLYRCDTLTGRVDREAGVSFVAVSEPANETKANAWGDAPGVATAK